MLTTFLFCWLSEARPVIMDMIMQLSSSVLEFLTFLRDSFFCKLTASAVQFSFRRSRRRFVGRGRVH